MDRAVQDAVATVQRAVRSVQRAAYREECRRFSLLTLHFSLFMRSTFTTLLLAAAASQASAQIVPVFTPARSDARFDQAFSGIAGIRELADGRLLVSDRLEQSLFLIDFRSGAMTSVGRQGQGPGEYTMPGPVFALSGDSSMLLDLGNTRGIIVTPDGHLGETVSLQTPEGLPLIPRGVDARGRLYAQPPLMLRGNATTSGGDSVPLIRVTPATQAVDTAAWIATAGLSTGGSVGFRSAGGGSFAMRAQPYAPDDGWAVASDGRIALVHAKGYRVEWLGPDGRRTAGPTLPYEAVRIGQAEKEQWADQLTKRSVMIMRTPEGSRSIRVPKPNLDEQNWPDTKPPFESNGVFVTPDGELWIRESRPARAGAERYDVVDAAGRLVRRVDLPAGRRLVGFGKGTLYTVQTDADDLEWLERYRSR
jgi:hypothetical protein